MLLSDFSDTILQLHNAIKDFEAAIESSNAEQVEILDLQCRIEDTITSLSIFFNKLPKLQVTYEALREYYIKEVLNRKKNLKEN